MTPITPSQPQIDATVIIPALNAADTIHIELDALAAQITSYAFEVVISDNGSTDATRDVAMTYADRFAALRIVDSSQHRGVSHARNVGARAAHADKIMFCDGDDRACPLWVTSMIDGLDEFDMVGGPLELGEINPPEVLDLIRDIRRDGLPSTLRYLPYAYGGNLGVRKRVFDAVGYFDLDYRGHEEVDFSWRAQEAGFTLGYAPDAILHYRQRADVWGITKQRFYFGRSNAQLQARYRRPGMPPFTFRRQIRVAFLHVLESRDLLRQPHRDRWIIGAGWVWGRIIGYLRYGRVGTDHKRRARRKSTSPHE